MLWCLWEGKVNPPYKPTEKEPLQCNNCSKGYLNLMYDAWAEDPAKRPHMESMLADLKALVQQLYKEV